MFSFDGMCCFADEKGERRNGLLGQQGPLRRRDRDTVRSCDGRQGTVLQAFGRHKAGRRGELMILLNGEWLTCPWHRYQNAVSYEGYLFCSSLLCWIEVLFLVIGRQHLCCCWCLRYRSEEGLLNMSCVSLSREEADGQDNSRVITRHEMRG